MKTSLAVGTVIVLIGLGVFGCREPETVYRNKRVTESTLDLMVEREIREAAAAANEEAARLAIEAKKNFNAFQLAVSQIDTTSAMEIQRLTADFEVSQADARLAMDQIAKRAEAAIASANEDAEIAQAELDRQFEQRSMGVKALNTIAGFVPGASAYTNQLQPYILGAIGIGGAGYLSARGRKKADEAWDESAKITRDQEEAKQKAREDEWNAALLFFSQQLASGRPVTPIQPPLVPSTQG